MKDLISMVELQRRSISDILHLAGVQAHIINIVDNVYTIRFITYRDREVFTNCYKAYNQMASYKGEYFAPQLVVPIKKCSKELLQEELKDVAIYSTPYGCYVYARDNARYQYVLKSLKYIREDIK